MANMASRTSRESATSLRLTAKASDCGRRLDAFVAQAVPPLSRARVQALIVDGNIQVESHASRAAYRLKGMEQITVTIPPDPPSQLQAQDLPLMVLYEDPWIVVINKSAGMVVHPGAGQPDGTLVNALLHRYPDLPRNDTGRPGLVHRLDKDTSGVLVCARTDEAHQQLSDAFRLRQVHKLYRVFCLGQTPQHFVCHTGHRRHPVHRKRFTTRGRAPLLPKVFDETETLREAKSAKSKKPFEPKSNPEGSSLLGAGLYNTDPYCCPNPPNNPRRIEQSENFVEKVKTTKSRLAHTEFTRLHHSGGVSELQARIFTGRTHQIRAHLADSGHPVLQDTLYGGSLTKATSRLPPGPVATAVDTLTRQALHAAELAFTHPVTGKPCHFQAPLSPDLQALHEALVGQEKKHARHPL